MKVNSFLVVMGSRKMRCHFRACPLGEGTRLHLVVHAQPDADRWPLQIHEPSAGSHGVIDLFLVCRLHFDAHHDALCVFDQATREVELLEKADPHTQVHGQQPVRAPRVGWVGRSHEFLREIGGNGATSLV